MDGLTLLDIFAIINSHEGHKMIRDPVEKLYAKIKTHEPLVLSCTRNFCDRLNQERDAKKPINLSHACLSLAIGMSSSDHRRESAALISVCLDVATTATFQHPSNYLAEPSFNENLYGFFLKISNCFGNV